LLRLMKIVDLIRREMIVPTLSAKDKRGILEELAAHVASQNPKIDRANLARVLIEREGLASTAIGEGVAIPHGKLAAVGEIVACLGRAPGGVDFDSMDGQPTFLFFVLIAPENSTGAHLKALARISRVFKDAEFRRRLLAAPDAEAMYRVVAEEDAKY
jgi:nitrogen PTS system EIIA component